MGTRTVAAAAGGAGAGHAPGWHPRLGIRESLSWTADWYLAHSAGENMAAFSEAQIARYRELMKRSP